MFNSLWYQNLTQPPLTPPAWVFGSVWGAIYLTIIIAFILYFIKKDEENKTSGYIFFAIQLILNLLWSPVFFRMQNIGLALIVIILMDIFIFLTIRKFYQISKASGVLLVPYQLWVLFATYLNAGYFLLN